MPNILSQIVKFYLIVKNWIACFLAVDPCLEKPCNSNEICDDNIDSHSCRCHADFTGRNCETKIDDCAGNPCKNNGACVDGINSFTCRRLNGFTGTRCETDVDGCTEIICATRGPEIQDQTTSLMVSNRSWNAPSEWTGPDAVVYRSFDNPDGLVLMQGTQQMTSLSLISGKVR